MGTKNATKKQTIKVKDLPAKNGKDIKGAAGAGCSPWVCGANHNETLLRD